MKEPMTQRHYDLLTAAGLLDPLPGRRRNDCSYCLVTLARTTGVATYDKDRDCMCIISVVQRSEEKHKFVYTQYERM